MSKLKAEDKFICVKVFPSTEEDGYMLESYIGKTGTILGIEKRKFDGNTIYMYQVHWDHLNYDAKFKHVEFMLIEELEPLTGTNKILYGK